MPPLPSATGPLFSMYEYGTPGLAAPSSPVRLNMAERRAFATAAPVGAKLSINSRTFAPTLPVVEKRPTPPRASSTAETKVVKNSEVRTISATAASSGLKRKPFPRSLSPRSDVKHKVEAAIAATFLALTTVLPVGIPGPSRICFSLVMREAHSGLRDWSSVESSATAESNASHIPRIVSLKPVRPA